MAGNDDYQEKRWLALVLLSAAQFVVVLDASIVNVALPSIGRALNFSQQNLPWVVNAYVLTFGGFLLLGGRTADLLGRRRVFMAGLLLVAVASLAAGFSTTEGQLIAARAAQGLGAAIVSPAALSIVTTIFSDGAERNRALGVWGAVAGAREAAGPILDLPHPPADRRQRGRPARRRFAVLDVLLHLPLHAAGARLQRHPRRPLLPAAGAADQRLGRDRLPAGDQDRLQARARHRAALHRRRPGLVQPGLGRRRLHHGHPRTVAARRRRPRLRLRDDHDRRRLRRRGKRVGPGQRPDQHLAADRWRTRAGGAFGGRDLAHLGSDGKRQIEPGERAHRGLPVRLPPRRRDRAGPLRADPPPYPPSRQPCPRGTGRRGSRRGC